jgi:hypothetical protein
MGGNINDSRPRPFGVVAGGTLLGPEGTARVAGFFGSGFGPETYTAGRDRPGLVGFSVGSGFGGVFVNWIVDASI